eukprot:TRINITY_DN7429_c0_g1_i1.p1 TRINITY_DN7429_c0_g1~~TRINITY_DN7429_c0_g1_i1.p1  ORF type:complete len:126 (+),score=8.99 TRINITY_DN7429_c0_g1_i1:124-501(+)
MCDMGFFQSKSTQEEPERTLEELEAIIQQDPYDAPEAIKWRYLALQSKVDPGVYNEYDHVPPTVSRVFCSFLDFRYDANRALSVPKTIEACHSPPATPVINGYSFVALGRLCDDFISADIPIITP